MSPQSPATALQKLRQFEVLSQARQRFGESLRTTPLSEDGGRRLKTEETPMLFPDTTFFAVLRAPKKAANTKLRRERRRWLAAVVGVEEGKFTIDLDDLVKLANLHGDE